MRSPLTFVCMAATLAAGLPLAALPAAAVAAPPAGETVDADSSRTWDENDEEDDSVEYYVRHARHARPVIGLQYGFGDVDRDGFGGELASVGAIEGQLGFRLERRYAGEDALIRQSMNFAFVGNLASRLASNTPGANEVGTDMWRFGCGDVQGYGYRFASNRGRVILQGGGGIGWYTLDVQGGATSGLSPADAASLEQFTSHTRFGESWESGVEVGFGPTFALHAGYERTVVFPGFKIWYWGLSTAIDRLAMLGVDLFVDEIKNSSPYAAPVVRFLLEGALQYGFYELRTEETNWPFNTEPPLAYDMFKLGVTTRF